MFRAFKCILIMILIFGVNWKKLGFDAPRGWTGE